MQSLTLPLLSTITRARFLELQRLQGHKNNRAVTVRDNTLAAGTVILSSVSATFPPGSDATKTGHCIVSVTDASELRNCPAADLAGLFPEAFSLEPQDTAPDRETSAFESLPENDDDNADDELLEGDDELLEDDTDLTASEERNVGRSRSSKSRSNRRAH